MNSIDLIGGSATQHRVEDSLLVSDLSVAYGRRIVLRNVAAEISRGQAVGVVGPNGGGKSTLLKAIAGIIPSLGGDVTLFGKPIAGQRSRVAFMPQREIVDWEFPVTAADVVMMGRYPRMSWPHRAGRRDREVVEEMLDRVGMLEYRDRQIGALSGGQQQRVFVARALAQEADVLLLDEPMTGIDASTQEVVMGIIEEQRQQGKIVLLATHDLYSASCACDCLCCVGERAVSFGPTEQMYTEETLTEVFGGPVIILGQQSESFEEGRHGYMPGRAAHHEHDHTHEVHG
ncbi:MAG TPA: metal ABC transporter ATP-binding protein [Dehalococcoidia bacterium]|nr:metal ABC transporter ATP-binding protein [Dehalococcoidia bacterium]